MPHIFPKKKKPSREGDITGLLEVTVQGSCLTEIDAYREAFGFATDVMVSTIKGCTIVDMFIVTALQCIMNHSFISLDMLTIVQPFIVETIVSNISDLTQSSASHFSEKE